MTGQFKMEVQNIQDGSVKVFEGDWNTIKNTFSEMGVDVFKLEDSRLDEGYVTDGRCYFFITRRGKHFLDSDLHHMVRYDEIA